MYTTVKLLAPETQYSESVNVLYISDAQQHVTHVQQVCYYMNESAISFTLPSRCLVYPINLFNSCSGGS